MDAQITRWINAFAGLNAFADTIAIWITTWGVPVMVAFVVLQWWSRHNRPHVRYTAICAGMAFLSGLALNQALLLVIHRVRPYDAGVTHLLIAPSADGSFPSDHATAAIAIAATFLIARLARRTILLAAMAALVCLSRIYVGTHYVTDVLGGTATGLFAAIIVPRVFRATSRLNRAAIRIL